MRFAIAASDQYLGVFEAFVQAGWQPLKLFVAAQNHSAVIACARRHQATIQLSRLTERDLLDLRDRQCDALVVASYDWRIDEWRHAVRYAVNFHCSPLPEGRGPYPLPRVILENRSAWAVTCHQVAPAFDCGDILAAEHFPLQPDECLERLDLKVQMAAKRLAARVAPQFEALWDQAAPQGEGSYWPRPTLPDRVVDFYQPVERVTRHIRAFAPIECLAQINTIWIAIKRATGWFESHDHPPGTVVHTSDKKIVVTAVDGYVAVLEWDLARQETVRLLHHGQGPGPADLFSTP